MLARILRNPYRNWFFWIILFVVVYPWPWLRPVLINTDFCHRIDGTAVLFCTVLLLTHPGFCFVCHRSEAKRSEAKRYPTYGTIQLPYVCEEKNTQTQYRDRIVILNGLANRSIIQRTCVVFLNWNECAKGYVDSIMFSNFFISHRKTATIRICWDIEGNIYAKS